MLQQVFTIYDTKAGAYLPPFFLPQSGMALRTFGDCVNDQDHQFNKHPEDYTLMALGTFDDVTGMLITTNPESLGNGLEFILRDENRDQEDLFPVESIGKQKPDQETDHKKGNSS